MKLIKKIAIKILPKKIRERMIFESNLLTNRLIKKFIKLEFWYELEMVNGLKVIARNQNFSDYDVFKQIFNYREYGGILSLFNLNENFKREKIIIDAGANVGYTTMFFSNNLESSMIFGVEPSETNYKIYKENIKNLEKSDSVKAYHRALSENKGSNFIIERDFHDKKDWSMTTKEVDDIDGNTIKGITIAEIIKENNLDYISLLKIDIEGAERFIFKKENDLSFLKITEIIAIEIHDQLANRKYINEILNDNNFLLMETGELTIGIKKSLI